MISGISEPGHKRGSWVVVCDAEGFLSAADSKAAYRQGKTRLWQIPPKSRDLDPVERFWVWWRRAWTLMELADLAKKRPVPGKFAYKERVKRLLKSPWAQKAAKNIFMPLRKTALDVRRRKGGASSRS